MSEQVIRHRGAGRDENGQLTQATDTALTAVAVAPGSGSQTGRDTAKSVRAAAKTSRARSTSTPAPT
ncbi:hypothetical protein ACNQQN_24825 [Mycobacteroides chelonae]|uniref:hypothetical protein n=1 Tax=Mycobacteroides chelonae TaxID=1774 RepID=UPI003AAF9883